MGPAIARVSQTVLRAAFSVRLAPRDRGLIASQDETTRGRFVPSSSRCCVSSLAASGGAARAHAVATGGSRRDADRARTSRFCAVCILINGLFGEPFAFVHLCRPPSLHSGSA